MRKYLFIISLLFCNLISWSQMAEENDKVTIMGLGDSITGSGKKCTTYLYPLWEMLTNENVNFEFVGSNTCKDGWGNIKCCGYSGRTVEFLDKHIVELYNAHPADIVLLHAGHNHFIEENPISGMIAAYSSIIDKILKINPDAHILVGQVIHSGKLPKYGYIPKLNKKIAKLVRSKSREHVHLVDLSRSFDWKKHTVKDKVHPNMMGATIMASEWMEVLKGILH